MVFWTRLIEIRAWFGTFQTVRPNRAPQI